MLELRRLHSQNENIEKIRKRTENTPQENPLFLSKKAHNFKTELDKEIKKIHSIKKDQKRRIIVWLVSSKQNFWYF